VVRVAIPTDSATVVATGSAAFSFATPLRLAELLKIAVSSTIGSRAPVDKLERSVRAVYAALMAGECVVDVDGRTYGCLDDIVMCGREATLRFFATSPGRTQSAVSRASS
jgi:hypothetical protein